MIWLVLPITLELSVITSSLEMTARPMGHAARDAALGLLTRWPRAGPEDNTLQMLSENLLNT